MSKASSCCEPGAVITRIITPGQHQATWPVNHKEVSPSSANIMIMGGDGGSHRYYSLNYILGILHMFYHFQFPSNLLIFKFTPLIENLETVWNRFTINDVITKVLLLSWFKTETVKCVMFKQALSSVLVLTLEYVIRKHLDSFSFNFHCCFM